MPPRRKPAAQVNQAAGTKQQRAPLLCVLKLSRKLLEEFPVGLSRPLSGTPTAGSSATAPSDSSDSQQPDGPAPPRSGAGPAAASPAGSLPSVSAVTTPGPRPRGRPGGVKKRKLDPSDPLSVSALTPSQAGTAVLNGGTSRSNPKTNHSAANVNLRALDRTGKPCRRWQRRSFTVRSFTGIVWEMDTWRSQSGPAKTRLADAETASETSSRAQLSHTAAPTPAVRAQTDGGTAAASPGSGSFGEDHSLPDDADSIESDRHRAGSAVSAESQPQPGDEKGADADAADRSLSKSSAVIAPRPVAAW